MTVVASRCNGLKRGLGSQAEIQAVLRRREHRILTTRPAVTDKGPGPSVLQKRIPTKTESSETGIFRWEKSTVHMGR